MKSILPAVMLLCSFTLSAQDFVQVSYGQSYKNQTYYRLADDAVFSLDNNAWDIAFTTIGSDDAGIHVNESSVVFGAENVLYLAPTSNFEDPIVVGDLTERLYNDEKSWDYGAFNSTRDEGDPDDFGWGILDSGTGVITGNTVFVLRLKDGTYRKIQIVSLDQGVYTLKYAELDGSNEMTLTIDKADFADQDFAFLSLSSGQTLPAIPIDWDLAFVRYAAPNDDGAGGIVQIVSSGVLSAPGVEVAQADNIIPEEVEYDDYIDSLSTDIDVIGWDWKFFNNISWELETDRAYFVKTTDGAVWKLVFVDFGGSTTGDVVFSKELVLQTGVSELENLGDLAVFPNPANGSATILFSTKHSGVADMQLLNVYGQQAWSGKCATTAGLNSAQLALDGLAPGQYFLTISDGEEVLAERMVKN